MIRAQKLLSQRFFAHFGYVVGDAKVLLVKQRELRAEIQRRHRLEKRTLPRAPADVSGFVRVTAHHPRAGSGILTRFPFDGRTRNRRVRRSSPVS